MIHVYKFISLHEDRCCYSPVYIAPSKSICIVKDTRPSRVFGHVLFLESPAGFQFLNNTRTDNIANMTTIPWSTSLSCICQRGILFWSLLQYLLQRRVPPGSNFIFTEATKFSSLCMKMSDRWCWWRRLPQASQDPVWFFPKPGNAWYLRKIIKDPRPTKRLESGFPKESVA